MTRDPAWTRINRQRTRQADDSSLGHHVGTVARRRAEALGRGDIDDPRRVGFFQMRQRRAYELLLRRQETRDGAIPNLVIAIVVERMKAREPGVVDQNIESAEAIGDFSDNSFDVAMIGDVEPPRIR